MYACIGGFITGGAYRANSGTQIFWPVTSAMYGLPIDIFSLPNILLEFSSFILALGVMKETKDFQNLFDWKFGTTSRTPV